MPTFERGDMFSMWGKTDLFLFTSNPVVNKQGLAVMGRGIAKQVADKYPEVRRQFGQLLSSMRMSNVGMIGIYDSQLVGWFRVKDHFAQPAKVSIISSSVNRLGIIADGYDRIDLNFPGIGNGQLSREDVLPMLMDLPDHVHIWEYDNG